MKRLMLFVFSTLMLVSCHNGDYVPKPYAYLRIDLPEADYTLCDTAVLPFSFQINKVATIEMKKQTPRDVWVDLKYPQWNGVVFLSYKRLAGIDDLRGQTDTSSRLLENHYQFASGVEEQDYEDREHHVYGTTYLLHGNRVASTYQFWLTDSNTNFLRGALYLNHVPNNDSLAPILEYIRGDVNHLVETIRWRK